MQNKRNLSSSGKLLPIKMAEVPAYYYYLGWAVRYIQQAKSEGKSWMEEMEDDRHICATQGTGRSSCRKSRFVPANQLIEKVQGREEISKKRGEKKKEKQQLVELSWSHSLDPIGVDPI